MEVDLARITSDDQRLNDLALLRLTTAKQHDAQPLTLFQTVPGLGQILRLVLLYAMHQSDRFPRLQDVASSCRLVQCAQASGGNRWGTAGNKMGNAPRHWAVSDAATLFLRGNEPGHTSLARWEQKHDTGQALRSLAHQLARAVYVMRKRQTAFDLEQCLCPSGAARVSPAPHSTLQGCACPQRP
jgi:transposase